MKQLQEKVPQGRTKIHNVRFYHIKPRSIQCMAYSKLQRKLAISRSDGSIEIWNFKCTPFLQAVIPKAPAGSVEGLVWSDNRLFSVGLTGELIEWNLHTLKPLYRQYATGNAIWCIDVSPKNKELALGTEEGYINIFDIDKANMQYKNLFDKQEGRILCCKYDHSGDFLVTGSVGCIRIWTVKDGHAIHKMTLGRSVRNKETIIWTLQVLKDFTIISGDSRGCVTVWDGNTAGQLAVHQVLKADVLTLAVNENETSFMCSGIDPIIRIYAKTKIKRDDATFNSWIKFLQRQVHDHDVKALVSIDDNVVSGGIDGYLGIASAVKAKPHISKYGPFLKNPCAAICQAKQLILLRYHNYLEIWQLGKKAEESKSDEFEPYDNEAVRMLPLSVGPEKLLELKSVHEDPIVCATISHDGSWFCYSTQDHIRIFRMMLSEDDGSSAGGEEKPLSLERIRETPEQFQAASHLVFSEDSKRLFVLTSSSKEIMIFSLLPNQTNELDFIESIDVGKHIKENVELFTVSPCSLYVAVGGNDSSISVWCAHQGKVFRHHVALPRYTVPVTAFAIHAQQPRLVASYSDGKIIEYDLDELCFTCSDSSVLPQLKITDCIRNIVLDKRNPNVFILHNDEYFLVLQKQQKSNEKDSGTLAKRPALKTSQNEARIAHLSLKYKRKFEHLIYLAPLSKDELVAVSVNANSLLDQMPGVLVKSTFGT